MRVNVYKTKLTDEGGVVLEKALGKNCKGLNKKMNGPEKAVVFAREFLHLHEQSEEYMYMLGMNTKLDLTSVFEISHGNVNSSVVGVRELFQKALLANAVSIIVMHNHPSGDCTPSREDIAITERIKEAGNILGIDLLDHIIIGESYCSLKEKGYI